VFLSSAPGGRRAVRRRLDGRSSSIPIHDAGAEDGPDLTLGKGTRARIGAIVPEGQQKQGGATSLGQKDDG